MKLELINLANSTVFRKLPMDLFEKIINNKCFLESMNKYTETRYGETFWYGGKEFNSNYRFAIHSKRYRLVNFWPFLMQSVCLERTPFEDVDVDCAKFTLHPKFKLPTILN